MAYVSGFDHDIFISYAHADNADGWVDEFHTRLQNRLKMLDRHANVTIWRDPKLSGTDLFSDVILRQLEQSALLISILSPNGVASDWCQQERQRFEQFAARNGGFRVDDKVRALKVVKTPLPRNAHRSIFGTLGFEFYADQPARGTFHEFHSTEPKFQEKLDELAQDAFALLNRLSARRGAKPPVATVYLASVGSELENRRQQVEQQLLAWSCRVLPEKNTLPSASPQLRATLEEQLGQSQFSVHLFGSQRGMIPDGEEQSILVLQYELARERRLERVIWSPKETPLHPALHASLAQDEHPGLERLEAQPVEELLQLLEDRIRTQRSYPASHRNGGLANIYVVCDPADWDSAFRLKTCLESAQCAVFLPMRDVEDERVRQRDHQDTLKTSDAVLVYWGNAKESWYRSSLRELIGARQKRRKKPLPALCLSHPSNPERDVYRRPDLLFAQVDDLRCETLRPLLRQLRTAPTEAAK